ncbi:unnamed protein product [Lupinus luteus]|uniref:HMA domain-containing protein n=1 Tax=Lupinus luteus TaxID=3873 RepID=A0AAV1W724_LUPLU
MGEEQNKPVEPKKPEEEEKDKKKEEEDEAKPTEEKKPEEPKTEAASPPPPPPEILLRVFMHCEGCARKVRRSLKGFPGVEDVITDCKSHKVVVKGEKADPLKVLERVQRKSHRKTELLSPIPKPEEKTPSEEEKPKPEEKKEEQPQFVTVVLKVHMHCEACAQEIKRRIQRMKGVESAEPDFKNSQVSVKGVYDPAKLVEYVYKRSGKQALILKQEPEPAKEEKTEEAKEEKKDEEENKEKKTEAEEKNKEEEKKNQETEGDTKPEDETAIEETNIAEVKKNEYYYYPPRSGMEICAYPTYPSYPPQIFSDENPNACSVM